MPCVENPGELDFFGAERVTCGFGVGLGCERVVRVGGAGRGLAVATGRDDCGRDVGRDCGLACGRGVGRVAVGREAVGRDAVGRVAFGREAVGREFERDG